MFIKPAFTLVEVLSAAVLVMISCAALSGLSARDNQNLDRGRAQEIAQNLIRGHLTQPDQLTQWSLRYFDRRGYPTLDQDKAHYTLRSERIDVPQGAVRKLIMTYVDPAGIQRRMVFQLREVSHEARI